MEQVIENIRNLDFKDITSIAKTGITEGKLENLKTKATQLTTERGRDFYLKKQRKSFTEISQAPSATINAPELPHTPQLLK